MSWMDSWSRPSKNQATPPPYYLLPGGDKVQYCKSCGRLIGDRKQKSSSTPAKYCSARCRSARHNNLLELEIEKTFVSLLNGETLSPKLEENHASSKLSMPPYKGGPAPKSAKKRKKGESRILVLCSEVETLIFGDRNDPDKCFGRRRNRKRRGVEDGEWRSVDMVSDEEKDKTGDISNDVKNGSIGKAKTESQPNEDVSSSDSEDDGGALIDMPRSSTETTLDPDVMARLSIRSGTRIRRSQETALVNGSIGGEKGLKERISETDDMLLKRREGQRKADERELVRCAARRGVAFGFLTGAGEERKMCEAIMQGNVVESSFAKGEWGVRWRE
ncbi:hypothetical protein HYALB_00008723 [Hymenoscyphus albidus]|uniref:Uncharacterized protein n=1 Tax=Hymenoscyphus albidus TaxID=595503 RepID=A0A9N9LS22_9HELO|nr:hypothetical protein HYALB_00008723 [Hymenoscyphus albidus]